MNKVSQYWLPMALLLLLSLSVTLKANAETNADHLDVLVVNPNLKLHDVLEKAFLRHPLQATLHSRDTLLSARNSVANATLPKAPSITIGHQNDALASGRGESDWQAELELPVWLPNQRSNRTKVADATQSNLEVSRQSLKLQVAGLVREAIWDVTLNNNSFALASAKLELSQNLQRDVEKSFKAGELAKTDFLLAQQETLRVEREKLHAEAEVMHARHRYYLLTGLKEIPGAIKEKQSNLEDYRQSPIWLEAQSKVGLSETERNLAQIESHENLQVSVNIRRMQGAFDNTFNDSVGLKVRIPFGEETHAAPIEAAAELNLGSALSERDSIHFSLKTAMHEAEHNLSISRAELIIASEQFDIAKESIRLAQKAFKLGELDLTSLMRIQAQTAETERAFTSRQIQLQWDIARYNQAVGVLP